MNDIRGIYSALVTPMSSDGRVDHTVLSQLVRTQLGRGVEGSYCCDSSGESLLLTTEERMEVLQTVIKEAAGSVPAIAHTGASRTANAIELSSHAEQTGGVALSMIPPFYYDISKRTCEPLLKLMRPEDRKRIISGLEQCRSPEQIIGHHGMDLCIATIYRVLKNALLPTVSPE